MPAPPPPNLPFEDRPEGSSNRAGGGSFSPPPLPRKESESPPTSGGEGILKPSPPEGERLDIPSSSLGETDLPEGGTTLKVMPAEYRGTRGSREMPLYKGPPPATGVLPRPLTSGAPEAKPKKRIISKKLALILIFLLLAGGGVFVYFNWFSGPQYESEAPPLSPGGMPGGIPSLSPGPGLPAGETPGAPFDTSPDLSTLDSDNDGLTDKEEEELGTNLKDADSDQDGLPDGWEAENKLNPLDPADIDQDPDSDNLDNSKEYFYHTDPHNSDTDGDSYLDGLEIEKGYDPTKAGAKLEEGSEAGREEREEAMSTSLGERDEMRKNDLKALELALALYYDDNGFFPSILTDLVPDYVVKIPEDPLPTQYSYHYTRISPTSYELAATLELASDPDDLLDGAQDQIYKVRVVE